MNKAEKILTLAAKAVSYKGAYCNKSWDGSWGIFSDSTGKYPEKAWNPIINEKDAHSLGMELQLNIIHEDREVVVEHRHHTDCRVIQRLSEGYDRNEATIYAITLVAAAIGNKMK